MAEHSIWGSGPPPVEPTAGDDGDPIVTANAFYSTAVSWYCVGGRLRVPAASVLPAQVTLSLRTTMYGTLVDLSAPPERSVVVDVIEGWTEGRWAPLLLPVTTAPDVTVAWICMEGAGNTYLYAIPPTGDPIQATDGANWFFAENGDPQERAAFRYGTGSTGSSGLHFMLDAIVTDDPSNPSGGSTATITVGTVGAGYARHSGGSAPSVAVDTVGQGFKRASGGSAAAVSVSAVGSGFNPDDIPDSLPVGGTLTPIITARGLTALTPGRGLEIV